MRLGCFEAYAVPADSLPISLISRVLLRLSKIVGALDVRMRDASFRKRTGRKALLEGAKEVRSTFYSVSSPTNYTFRDSRE